MLSLSNLYVSIAGTEILHDINVVFERGKNICILGKNGSGKTSLTNVIMGHPAYTVTDGSITLDGANLLAMSPEERALKGIFCSFQQVPEIAGVKMHEYLRTIYNLHLPRIAPKTKPLSPVLFDRFVKPILASCDIAESFLERDLNVGLSGGEKRKFEVLQLKLLKPTYMFLDEIDSGLDRDAFGTISEVLKTATGPETCCVIITHHFQILDQITPDTVIELSKGKISHQGGPELAHTIRETGFQSINT